MLLKRLRLMLFSLYAKVIRALAGKGLGKIPGAGALKRTIYKILRPKQEVMVTVSGHTMFVNATDTIIAEALMVDGIYEEYEMELFVNNIREGGTVVDLGASVGCYTLAAARKVGETGKVYAFEPEPGAFALLQKNVSYNGYGNVIMVNKAVSDRKGTAALHVHSTNFGMHSIVHGESDGKTVVVETLPLDGFFEDVEHDSIDVLKIDCEGAEGLILHGAQNLLKENRPIIFMEFLPDWLENAGTPPAKIMEDFAAIGYSISLLDETKREVRPIEISELMDMWKQSEGLFRPNLLISKGSEQRG